MSPEGFDGDEMAENYRIYTLKKILFIVICIIAVVAVIGYAATIGSSNISAADVYRDIWYHSWTRADATPPSIGRSSTSAFRGSSADSSSVPVSEWPERPCRA